MTEVIQIPHTFDQQWQQVAAHKLASASTPVYVALTTFALFTYWAGHRRKAKALYIGQASMLGTAVCFNKSNVDNEIQRRVQSLENIRVACDQTLTEEERLARLGLNPEGTNATQLCPALVFTLDEERLHEINDLARAVGCQPVFADIVEMSIRPGAIDRLDQDPTSRGLDEEKGNLVRLFQRLEEQLDSQTLPLERDGVSCVQHGLILSVMTGLAVHLMFLKSWRRSRKALC